MKILKLLTRKLLHSPVIDLFQSVLKANYQNKLLIIRTSCVNNFSGSLFTRIICIMHVNVAYFKTFNKSLLHFSVISIFLSVFKVIFHI